MKLVIKELDHKTIEDVGKSNEPMIINSQLVLRGDNNKINYYITGVPPYEKKYENLHLDYSGYIDNPDKIIYLAYIDEEIAGQMTLRKNWNKCSYIEEIAIRSKFRRLGIGKKLIEKAEDWSKKRDLNGIMLETQNNNASACLFYRSCGFVLGGFDMFLYKGIDRKNKEVALFWYLFF